MKFDFDWSNGFRRKCLKMLTNGQMSLKAQVSLKKKKNYLQAYGHALQ